jgi:murein DD-endopeptidase MepM/ murein hydrolase activator NlpD
LAAKTGTADGAAALLANIVLRDSRIDLSELLDGLLLANGVLPDFSSYSLVGILRQCHSSCPGNMAAKQSQAVMIAATDCSKNSDGCSKTIETGAFAGAHVVKSKIRTNFYADAMKHGIPPSVLTETIKHIGKKIDFHRALKRGDMFEIMYDDKRQMLYAKITTKRNSVAVYKYCSGKETGYYFSNGEKCIQNAGDGFFAQPLAGRVNVSDKFGGRRHPITGKYQYHTGVDLRANYGSPVYAICAGVVTRSSYYAGYGHCVDIKHASGYASRYGHLSKYAVRCGCKVKKGQVVGYVGSSGVSTGPHLHLELAHCSRVFNPLSMHMIPVAKAKVKNMRSFEAFKAKVSHEFRK